MRVHERLDELYAIGGGVGANRVAGTEGEDRAHELAAGWMREAGLEVEVDDAANLIGRTAESSVWTGSHLDSVPYGGKFDGALGVVAAIEAVERVGKGAVAVFRDEERGCVGSSAFVEAGALPECFLEGAIRFVVGAIAAVRVRAPPVTSPAQSNESHPHRRPSCASLALPRSCSPRS